MKHLFLYCTKITLTIFFYRKSPNSNQKSPNSTWKSPTSTNYATKLQKKQMSPRIVWLQAGKISKYDKILCTYIFWASIYSLFWLIYISDCTWITFHFEINVYFLQKLQIILQNIHASYKHITRSKKGNWGEKFRKKSAIYLNIMVFYRYMLFYPIIQINS